MIQRGCDPLRIISANTLRASPLGEALFSIVAYDHKDLELYRNAAFFDQNEPYNKRFRHQTWIRKFAQHSKRSSEFGIRRNGDIFADTIPPSMSTDWKDHNRLEEFRFYQPCSLVLFCF